MALLFSSPSSDISAPRLRNGVLLSFLAICFLMGSLLGTFYKSTTPLPFWIFDLGFNSSKIFNISAADFVLFSRFQILAFLVGLSVFGTAFLPVLLLARGLTFSLTAASIISALGDRGIIIAFAIMGIQILVSLPCLLWISTDAFGLSRSLFGFVRGRHPPADKGVFVHFLVSLPILFAASVLEKYIFQFAASRFG